MKIQHASLDWKIDHLGNTVPISNHFDDVYFSHAGGLDESHHVFVEGNQLTHRFGTLSECQTFVVAETGFGTGLNFLATYQLWYKLKSQGNLATGVRLHFISTEKFPLSRSDLIKALKAWQHSHDDGISTAIKSLIDNYPLPLAGCHRIHVCDDVMLDLWLGDALDSFQSMHQANQTQHHTTFGVNAWFLDGFAPSKNDDLWSNELFELIKLLSAHDATLATFTAAGFVRRGLQAVGFNMTKNKGFGRKREMLTGKLSMTQAPCPSHTLKHIAVIGAGVSGLCIAHALACRGIKVTLLDKHTPPSGASGNPCAMFAPKLSAFEQADHHLSTVAFLYAARFYERLNSDGDLYDCSGVLDFLLPTKKSHDKLSTMIAPYPNELIHEISAIYPNQIIHTYIPKAGLIFPKNLAKAILKHSLISFRQFSAHTVIEHADGVKIVGDCGELNADKVIISSGHESHLLTPKLFNPRKIRGQVSWLSLNDDIYSKLPTHPIKYDGYCAKYNHESGKSFLIGASFVRNCTDTKISLVEHQFNLDKLANNLPAIADLIKPAIADLQGRASIRAQTPDYHPIVGQIDQHSYAMYGMGSKGFTFAPFCAEILAAMITHEMLPASHELLKKIEPNRPRLANPITDHEI